MAASHLSRMRKGICNQRLDNVQGSQHCQRQQARHCLCDGLGYDIHGQNALRACKLWKVRPHSADDICHNKPAPIRKELGVESASRLVSQTSMRHVHAYMRGKTPDATPGRRSEVCCLGFRVEGPVSDCSCLTRDHGLWSYLLWDGTGMLGVQIVRTCMPGWAVLSCMRLLMALKACRTC